MYCYNVVFLIHSFRILTEGLGPTFHSFFFANTTLRKIKFHKKGEIMFFGQLFFKETPLHPIRTPHISTDSTDL